MYFDTIFLMVQLIFKEDILMKINIVFSQLIGRDNSCETIFFKTSFWKK